MTDNATMLAATQKAIREDHTCACPHDDPTLNVATQKQGPQHISVRFWDDPEERARSHGASILLNGEPVTGVFEAILGEQGTIWRYRGIPSAARNGTHRCLTCEDRLRAQGVMSEIGSWQPSSGVPYEDVQLGICTERLTGHVELKAGPQQDRVVKNEPE